MTHDDRHGVTLVSGASVRAGCHAAYEAAHRTGVEAARGLGGLVRAELVPAIPGIQDDVVALMTFRTRADLDRWLESDERAETMRAMAALTAGDRRLNVLSSFPGWLPGDTGIRPPARWRQAVLVVAGLIPVALAVTLLRDAVAPGLPVVVSVAVTSALNVAALTWIVMPILNRCFESWLSSSV